MVTKGNNFSAKTALSRTFAFWRSIARRPCSHTGFRGFSPSAWIATLTGLIRLRLTPAGLHCVQSVSLRSARTGLAGADEHLTAI